MRPVGELYARDDKYHNLSFPKRDFEKKDCVISNVYRKGSRSRKIRAGEKGKE